MQVQPIEFSDLSFSQLFCEYCENRPDVLKYFDFSPFNSDDISKKIESYTFSGTRSKLKGVIDAYNDPELLHDAAKRNIERLINDNRTLTVVTGQQLTVAGGPLYTVYKILTAISKAREIEQKFNIPVVPVFWLADEDHDFPEISKIGMPSGKDWSVAEINKTEDDLRPVSFIKLGSNHDKLLRELDSMLIPTDFKADVIDATKNAYSADVTHGEAFGKIILRLFSRYGLIVMGSVKPESRQVLKPYITELLDKTEEIYRNLEGQSAEVEKKYHRQAAVTSSNWFIIDENRRRLKLNFSDGKWSVDDTKKWSTEELKKIVDENPEVISPNVFMRPILQDLLLPNVAYIAGPGEISYYAQMKSMYKTCNLEMPILIPRFSATLLESAISRFFEELPFKLQDYNQRIEDLEKNFIESKNELDIQNFANLWIKEVSLIADSHTKTIESFDASLIGTLVRVKNEQINAINSIRQKMIKSAKNKESVQLDRIRRVQMSIFPNRNLQEREMASVYFINKYGLDFIDQLLHTVSEVDLKQHYLLRM